MQKTMMKNHSGSIVIMLAVILPVLFILCAIAINLAQIQLARTELKIATDASARAGGRAWSFHNDQQLAIDFATAAAEANTILNKPMVIDENSIVFGNTVRSGDAGRFDFTPVDNDSELEFATAIRVNSQVDNLLPFEVSGIDSVTQRTSTVASQVNRDIALIVDRSGSMAYFENEDFLYDHITSLYEEGGLGITKDEYDAAVADYQPIARLAAIPLDDRAYSNKILDVLIGDLLEYADSVNSDYRPMLSAPKQSRWAVLEQATRAFFETLQESASKERVSVSSFASDANLELPMTFDIAKAQDVVLNLYPTGSTAIGLGMEAALPNLIGEGRRASAIPTILLFSDGENKKNPGPVSVAENIIRDHPDVVINTVTFADGDQTEMAEVAATGNGKHYHANDGDELILIFKEIAKSFSTVITE